MRNFKSYLKSRNFKRSNGGKDKRRPKKRPCYKCGEYGHFIAECPNKKNKDKEDEKKNKYKKENKSYDHKKKYFKQAHIGVEWTSSDEESKDEGVATLVCKSHPLHQHASSTTYLVMMKIIILVALWPRALR